MVRYQNVSINAENGRLQDVNPTAGHFAYYLQAMLHLMTDTPVLIVEPVIRLFVIEGVDR